MSLITEIIRKHLILASFLFVILFFFLYLTKPLRNSNQRSNAKRIIKLMLISVKHQPKESIYKKLLKFTQIHPLLLAKRITHNVTFCKRCHWNKSYCHNFMSWLSINHKQYLIPKKLPRHSTQFRQIRTSEKHAT